MWDFACFVIALAAFVGAALHANARGELFRDEPVRMPPRRPPGAASHPAPRRRSPAPASAPAPRAEAPTPPLGAH
jgi:hypothetical protein